MGTSITMQPSTNVLLGVVTSPMIVTSDTFQQTIDLFTKSSSTEWIIDVETNGLNPYDMHQLCGIGISTTKDSDNIYYFPFRHQSEEPNLSQQAWT